MEKGIIDLNGQFFLSGLNKNLSDIKKLLQINDPEKELLTLSVEKDDLGYTHIRYQQIYQNIEVDGGLLVVHMKENKIESITNRLYPSPKISIWNTVNPETVIAEIYGEFPLKELDEIGSHLLSEKRITVKKIIYHQNMDHGLEKLCYKIEYRPNLLDWWEFIVEAKNGNFLEKTNKTCSIDGPRTASASDLNSVSRTINTYQVGNTYYLLNTTKSMFNSGQSNLPNKGVGVIWTLDANFTDGKSLFNNTSSNNSWNNKAGVSAHFNASLAFDYFINTHSRNSINGSGGNVVSIINVNNENGTKMDNAYWNGEMMFYGNGNTSFFPLAGSLDVGGHEMTHGVVQNTAYLEYKGQSGAINESMADVFGS